MRLRRGRARKAYPRPATHAGNEDMRQVDAGGLLGYGVDFLRSTTDALTGRCSGERSSVLVQAF